MKNNNWADGRFSRTVVASCIALLCVSHLHGQVKYSAWDLPAVTKGNHKLEDGLGIGNDFEVLAPVTIWSVGVFDDGGDGIQGGTVLKVHLYASNPDRARKRASGALLETVLFDAADPGQLVGGFRYKPLLRPVTLIPGQYTITAEGFDERNLDYRRPEDPTNKQLSQVRLNDAGGLIRFTGLSHFHIGHFLQRTRTAKNVAAPERAPDRYGAATFTFSAAAQYASPFASDYAALTAGVGAYQWDTNKSRIYSYPYGSVSVLGSNAFAVIVEPSGNRTIFEAAGVQPNGSRCVVFADEQWAYSRAGDAKANLFENAIRWASRKATPAEIVIGLSTNMDAGRFLGRGFRVVPVDGDPSVLDGTTPTCDVMVLDFRGQYGDRLAAVASEYAEQGVGIVAACAPAKSSDAPALATFEQVNTLLRPFGIAFRSSAVRLNDLALTNLQIAPYPPSLFNAFPAAELLHQNRLGQAHLTSLEKVLALNTMSYAADGQPELLAALASAYSGSSNSVVGVLNGTLGSFSDAVVLTGAAANSNRLGRWLQDRDDLVSVDQRGSVEYDFELRTAGLYRIELFGAEDPPRDRLDILLSVDGISLGQYSFKVPYGNGTLLSLFAAQLGQYDSGLAYATNDHISCLTPFLTAGPHKLRVVWNNPNSFTGLRLQSVHVQSAIGADGDGDGTVDWVKNLIDSQSGLDLTNELLTSYTSPLCVEGHDPFPSLMQVSVTGAEKAGPNLTPWPAPSDRWYVNVPLASGNDVTFHVSYQNDCKSEIRRIRWLPLNVLNGGSYTIRDGDSLLLVARPEGRPGAGEGSMQFVIGTNQFVRSASSPLPYVFTGPAVVTLSGTFTSPEGVSQTGSIVVKVVRHGFASDPACHVGEERNWKLSLPPGATLETDERLLVGQFLEGESQTSLTIDQSEPRYILSRLGADGPVLNSGVARGFDFWSGKNTSLYTVKTFPDGSELLEMRLVMYPILPDVTVQMEVFVGGVVFEDGTTSKVLTREDFDALGRCYVRFIHPPTFKPAVCHTITLRQGDAVIGRGW